MPPKIHKAEGLELTENEDGTVTCPSCGEKIGLGRAGFPNFVKNHYKSDTCNELADKKEKREKQEKQAERSRQSLSNFLSRARAKVPSTITAPKVVPPTPVALNVQGSTTRTSSPPPDAPRVAVLDPLVQLLPHLPNRLPTKNALPADQNPFLATIPSDPTIDDDPNMDADELFETVVNPRLHQIFPWGERAGWEERLDGLDVERLSKLVKWVRHFIIRGIPEAVFEARLAPMIAALKSLQSTIRASPPPPEVISLVESEDDERDSFPQSTAKSNVPETHLPPLPVRCQGLRVPIPNGSTAISSYPFFLHEDPGYPWDFAVRSGILYLQSRSCHGGEGTAEVCAQCRRIQDDNRFEGILRRMKEGIREGTNLPFYPFSGLHKLIVEKNRQVDFYRLRGLNQARKIGTSASSLDNHKRFIMALATREVPRVHAVVRVGLRKKMGIKSLLQDLLAAASRLRSPKDYQEEEYLKGILLWKLGGDRLATIAHRALGLPSVTTLRNQLRVPAILASPGRPTEQEVTKNVNMGFEGVEDQLNVDERKRVIHAVLQFDEICTECRLRWDPVTNTFMGLCREHASEVSLEFASEKDMEHLYAAVDEGKVHIAREATIAAVGLLSPSARLQAPRVALVSSDCKQESGEEHLVLIKTVYKGANQAKTLKNVRIICIATDGERRRGLALILFTFQFILPNSSPIFIHVGYLFLMDLHVGPDDITPDKDWKHVIKRSRNNVLRAKGITINNICITPAILRAHFLDAGMKPDRVKALLDPNDKQDVKLAFDLLQAIWDIKQETSSKRPGFQETRNAIRALGTFFFHLLYPYICVDLSLSEQLAHLSAAAHLAFHHFRAHGSDFLNAALYVDIMIMIKNVFFCVVKAKVDDPDGSFWLILLGTDRLEELFGTLRTMIGNDANVDVLQLSWRLGGCTEVANILSQHPDWDRPPRRLNLPAIRRENAEPLPNDVDHLKPRFWQGNVLVSAVSLQTAWVEGRKMAERACPELTAELKDIRANPSTNITILAPHGTLLVTTIAKNSTATNNHNDDDDDDDYSFESEPPTFEPEPSTHPTATLPIDPDSNIEVEDTLGQLAVDASATTSTSRFDKTIILDGHRVPKSRALAIFGRYRNTPSSTDRLKRVQNVARYTLQGPTTHVVSGDDEKVITLHDPITSLLACEGRVWLSIGEVLSITMQGRPVESILHNWLGEKGIIITYQLMGLKAATQDDDPRNKFDWRTYRTFKNMTKCPGRLVEPINPAVASPPSSEYPFFLLSSEMLVPLSASLYARSTTKDLENAPRIAASSDYPYRDASGKHTIFARNVKRYVKLKGSLGKLCFLCEDERKIAGLDSQESVVCEYCTPPKPFSSAHGLRILEHMAAHILHDPQVKDVAEPCGLCLQPSPACQFFVKRSTGRTGKDTMDRKSSKCHNLAARFQYSAAATSSKTSPCSNVPINCPLCPPKSPAVWKYNFKVHLRNHHPGIWESTGSRAEYEHFWTIAPYEKKKLLELWRKLSTSASQPPTRGPGAKKQSMNVLSGIPISEAHRSSNVAVPDSEMRNEDSEEELDSEVEPERASDSEGALESESGSESEPDFDKMDVGAVSPDSEADDSLELEYLSEDEPPAAPETPEVENEPVPSSSMLPPPPPIDPEPLTTPDTPQAAVPDPPPAPDTLTELGRGRRPRTKRTLDETGGGRSECLCGSIVRADEVNVAVCSRAGCETKKYHLQIKCIGTDIVERNWVCDACRSSTRKRTRR